MLIRDAQLDAWLIRNSDFIGNIGILIWQPWRRLAATAEWTPTWSCNRACFVVQKLIWLCGHFGFLFRQWGFPYIHWRLWGAFKNGSWSIGSHNIGTFSGYFNFRSGIFTGTIFWAFFTVKIVLVIVYFFVVVFFLFKLDGAVKEGESGCGMEVIPTMLELKCIKMLTPAYNIIQGPSLIYVTEKGSNRMPWLPCHGKGK